MLYALLAGLIGAVFIGITSVIPFVNMLNMCCGAWVVMGGMLSAFLWTRFNGGRASFMYGMLSGVLAGGILSFGVLAPTGAWVSVSAASAGKTMAALPEIQQLPSEPITAEEMLEIAEQLIEKNQKNEREKASALAKIDQMRNKLETARATPKDAAQIKQAEELINSLIAGVKAGDLSPLVNLLLLCFAGLACLLVMLSTVGGFFGGLMFGSDGPRVTESNAASA